MIMDMSVKKQNGTFVDQMLTGGYNGYVKYVLFIYIYFVVKFVYSVNIISSYHIFRGCKTVQLDLLFNLNFIKVVDKQQ